MSLTTIFQEDALVDAALGAFRDRIKADILAKLRADMEPELLAIATQAAKDITSTLMRYNDHRNMQSYLEWKIKINGETVQ